MAECNVQGTRREAGAPIIEAPLLIDLLGCGGEDNGGTLQGPLLCLNAPADLVGALDLCLADGACTLRQPLNILSRPLNMMAISPGLAGLVREGQGQPMALCKYGQKPAGE